MTKFLLPVLVGLSGCQYSGSDDDVFFDAGPLRPALRVDSSIDELSERYQDRWPLDAGFEATWRPDSRIGTLQISFYVEEFRSDGACASCVFDGIAWVDSGELFEFGGGSTACVWPLVNPGPPANWEIYLSLGCVCEEGDIHLFHTPEPSPPDEVTAICEQYQGNELVEVGGFEDLSFDILIRDYF